MYSVIIIEDDPVIINLNSVFLGDCDFLCLKGVFRTADEAINYILHSPVDLVLLDLHLPGMNGIEFMETIRQKKLRVQVIVLTMDNDVDAFRELYAYGILDYLIKPYSKLRFTEAMNCFLQRARLFNSRSYVTQEDLDSGIAKYTYAKSRSLSNPASKSIVNVNDCITPGLMTKNTANRNQMVSDYACQKGIQPDTCERFIVYLKERSCIPLSIDELVGGMSLSKVTVRRYMAYLKDLGLVTANINYSTGGRPSMLYIYNSESVT